MAKAGHQSPDLAAAPTPPGHKASSQKRRSSACPTSPSSVKSASGRPKALRLKRWNSARISPTKKYGRFLSSGKRGPISPSSAALAPLILFAKRLKPYLRGILASARFPMNTSILEGVNNRIKVIKRMAYGFRDSAYFFLKIKDAFPGKAR